jgi:hypothetical protein
MVGESGSGYARSMAEQRAKKSVKAKAKSSAKKPEKCRAPKPAKKPVKAAARPVKAAAKPVKAAARPVKAAARPVKAAARPVKAAARPVKAAARPVKVAAGKAVKASARPSLAKTLPRPSEPALSLLERRLGPPDADLRDAIFDGVEEAALVEIGTRIDSADILREVPLFAGAALAIERSLSTAQRENLLLSPGILAVLVGETQKLRALLGAPEATTPPSGNIARELLREGLALRNNVTEALRNALGATARAKVEELLSTAEAPERLGEGLSQLATFIEELLRLGDRHEHLRLKAFHLTAGRAQLLRDAATRLRGQVGKGTRPEAQTGASAWAVEVQRRLDLQDGRVVELIERVLRAFRAAHRQDRSIRVPELRYIGWLFDARSREPPLPEEG